MNEWQTDKILPLLKECGRIALSYYENPPLELKHDQTVVTAADKEIEAKLAEEFDRPEEGSFLIGEETVSTRSEEYLESALKGTAWVVDPIDGTAPYSAHFPAWGISLALMRNKKIIEGAIYLPPQDEIIYTCGNSVFIIRNFMNGGSPEKMDFRAQALNPAGPVSISQHGAKQGKFNIPNQVFAWSGCVASFYGLFTGRLMAYSMSVKLWDIAGAIPLMEHGGYLAVTDSGEQITSTITDELFDLDLKSPDCWRLRDNAVAAASREIIEYICKNINIPIKVTHE